MKAPVLLFLLLASAFLGQLALPGGLSAQEAKLFEDEACRQNPHTEQCVCARVRAFSMYPLEYDGGAAADVDKDGHSPVYNQDGGYWESGDPDDPQDDLGLFVDERYGQHCSLSYFRENLRRTWYFLAALGASFAAISMTWAGVAYMQESSSGTDLSRVRGMIVRVLLGMIILSCAFLVWEGLSGFMLGHFESWTLERGVFYDSYE